MPKLTHEQMTKIIKAIRNAAFGDALGAGCEMVPETPQTLAKTIALIPSELVFINDRRGEYNFGYWPGWVTDDTRMTGSLLQTLIENYDMIVTTSFVDEYSIQQLYDNPTIQLLLLAHYNIYQQESNEIYAEASKHSPEAVQNAKNRRGWGQIALQFICAAKALKLEEEKKISEAWVARRKAYEEMQDKMRKMGAATIEKDKQPGNVAPMHIWAVGFLPNIEDVDKIASVATLAVQDNKLSVDCSIATARLAHTMLYDDQVEHKDLIAKILCDMPELPKSAPQRDREARTRLREYMKMIDELPGFSSTSEIEIPKETFSKICEGNTTLMFIEPKTEGLNPKVLYTVGVIYYILKHHTPDTNLSIALARLIHIGGDVDSSASIGMGILSARYSDSPNDDIENKFRHLLEQMPQGESVSQIASAYVSFINSRLSETLSTKLA